MTNKHQWQLSDKFYFEKDDLIGITPSIVDFNNDGFKDLTYISGTAARGSNEVRKLFVYNSSNNNFVYIKNSESYPNLFYNMEMNCINSQIFTGCTTTAFLRVEKDSLREFAWVDVCDSITVEELDRDGKFKMIEKKKFNEHEFEMFTPFKSYRPLKQ